MRRRRNGLASVRPRFRYIGSAGQSLARGYYAREIANLVNWLGADHVGFGTDMEGLGTSWSVNNYSGVRNVVDELQELNLPASTIEKVANGNYARVLKAALKG